MTESGAVERLNGCPRGVRVARRDTDGWQSCAKEDDEGTVQRVHVASARQMSCAEPRVARVFHATDVLVGRAAACRCAKIQPITVIG